MESSTASIAPWQQSGTAACRLGRTDTLAFQSWFADILSSIKSSHASEKRFRSLQAWQLTFGMDNGKTTTIDNRYNLIGHKHTQQRKTAVNQQKPQLTEELSGHIWKLWFTGPNSSQSGNGQCLQYSSQSLTHWKEGQPDKLICINALQPSELSTIP